MIKEINFANAIFRKPQINVGDRVVFYYESPQRGGHSVYRPVYCIVTKLNKVTAIVATEDKQYKVSLDELNLYVDPFNWLNQ
jgi:hypothetical protein